MSYIEGYGKDDYFTKLQLKTLAVLAEAEGNTNVAAQILSKIEKKQVTSYTINNRLRILRDVIKKARNTVNRAQNLKKNPYLRKRLEDYI